METTETIVNTKHCAIPCPLLLKDDLPPIAKLIYGVIYYQHKSGVAQIKISNDEFAKIFSISIATVKNSLKSLKTINLIDSELEGRHRVIKLVDNDWDFSSWKNINHELVSLENSYKDHSPEPKEYPQEIIEIIKHWNSKKHLPQIVFPVCFEGTVYEATPVFDQTAETIRRVMNGTLFNSRKACSEYHNRKWSITEIKKAIDHFQRAATDPAYYPIRKDTLKTRKLKDFFYCDFIQNPKYRSAFFNSQAPPKPLKYQREEALTTKVPMLALSIKRRLVETFFGGRMEAIKTHDENKITRAANLLSERMQGSWKYYFNIRPGSMMMAGYVCEVLQDMEIWKSDPITIITHEWWWDKVYPAYLVKRGVMSSYPSLTEPSF